ncbi:MULTISPECIES: hypothetical protein [Streptomyces]|nr:MULTISPECIES: hypothetical protein [unclassified Streptomyces]
MLEHEEIFSSATRLDRSLALNAQDYREHLRRAEARTQPIVAAAPEVSAG